MAAEAGIKIQPLEQFQLHSLLASVNFTQANAWMVLAAVLVLALLYYGSAPRAVVPGRLQAAAELAYDFVYRMAVEQIGPEGKRFFPFVFTLFSFVLMGNVLGLIPYGFTYTSHVAITGALAVMVIVLVTGVAIAEHGWHFFGYFFPPGAPKALAPLIVPIEVISYLSRPVSLSIRLFANMVAGHVMLAVFAAFVVMLGSHGGILSLVSVGPVALNTVLVGFELLVAGLQAYVFAILTCIYLHDAVLLH